MEGYIKLHRQMLGWEWFDNEKVLKVFIYCLLRANHKDTKWKGIIIKKGEFVTSLNKLAEETNLSVRNIRTSINKLEKTSEVTSKGYNKFTIVKVNNWDKYQVNDHQVTNNGQTNDKQLTTDKNDKNEKNEKNIISNDITTEVGVFGNSEINVFQELIKSTVESHGFIYKSGNQERNRIRNIATAKSIGLLASKSNLTRHEFVCSIINLANTLPAQGDFSWRGKITNAVTWYKHYDKVMNYAIEIKASIKKDTSQMSGDEALEEAKRRGLV